MTIQEYINRLLDMKSGLTLATIRTYNTQLTRTFVTGESQFTAKLLEDIVCDVGFNIKQNRDLICFVAESIVSHETKPTYLPEVIEEYNFWAIDKNGLAFYYEAKPNALTSVWSSEFPYILDVHEDKNFNKEKFFHLYEGKKWKSSLLTLINNEWHKQ